jgi:hypothetical protein
MPSTIGITASSVWTPLELPGLAGWWDASDTSTITASSGSVSQWNDKSSNGRNVSQGSGAAQPTTGASTRNGLNVLDFDGGDFLLAATASDWTFLHSAKSVVFSVFRAGNTTDPEAFYVIWGTSLTVLLPTGANFLHDTRSSIPRNDALVHTSGPASSGPNFRVLHAQQNLLPGNVWGQGTVVGDIANSTLASRSKIRLNGGSDLTGSWSGNVNTNTSTPRHPFAIGSAQDSSGVFAGHLVGSVAEVIVVNGELNSSEIETTEKYLLSKWGI